MANLIIGGFGNQILNGVDGTDNFIYGDTNLTVFGNTGPGGNDTITGGANGTNTIYGDADTIMGNQGFGGNDIITGGTNSINVLVGDAIHFAGPAKGGNDTITGGVGGSNTLIGDGIDTNGPESGGNDRLVSADNTTDNMWGDFQSGGTGGQDTFVFDRNNGNDIIHDYQQGFDNPIELDGFFKNPHIPTNPHIPLLPPQAGNHILETFADLNISEVDANNDGHTDSVIHFDANNSVTVLNVTGLTAADFHFVV